MPKYGDDRNFEVNRFVNNPAEGKVFQFARKLQSVGLIIF